MNKDISRLNIEHFRKLLESETDEAKRRMVHSLLAEEEAKLDVLNRIAREQKAS